MPRIHVNNMVNVLTGDETKGYRSPGREPLPEITVPSLRARMSISEAKKLVECLSEGIVIAEAKLSDAVVGRLK